MPAGPPPATQQRVFTFSTGKLACSIRVQSSCPRHRPHLYSEGCRIGSDPNPSISPSLVLSPRVLPLPTGHSNGRCHCPIRRGPSLGTARRQSRCHPDTQTCALARSDPAQKSAAPSHVLHQDPHRTYGNSTGTTGPDAPFPARSEEHTSELQSHSDLVCRLLLEKKK